MAKLRKHKHRRTSQPHGLAARSARPKLKPHHTKPYRFRHIVLLIAALAYTLLLTFQLGLIVGGSRQQTEEPVPSSSAQPQISTVSSSYGFSFDYETATFAASANAVDENGVGAAVAKADLDANKPISFAQIKPKAESLLRSNLAASQLSIQAQTNKQQLASLSKDPASKDKTNGQLAFQLLPLTNATDFEVTQLSQANEIIGDGSQVLRTTYQFTPKFEGGLSYATTWHGVVDERAFVIKLTGLVTSSAVPAEYATVLDTVKLNGPKVQGLSFSGSTTAYAAESALDTKYIADLASPSVVKIYHIMCGNLVVGSNKYPNTCDGGTGSGAILSQDGYIATNGHVVVITAKDILVREITRSPETFAAFLRGAGYSDSQITEVLADSQKLAALIAKVYDLPDTEIFLDQPQEITLVALGDEPLSLTKDTKLADLFATKDTDNMKVAKIIGTDYNSKDLWVAQSGDPTGFSSSDVALLKTDLKAAPSLTVSATPITQNEKIVVLGFPGDAENPLVDNTSLDVSVTNGSISAIKDVAGGNGKLYQSDADASHGNSGGPAITQNGEVFGLLTYRLSGDDQGNAAKSYIRDVADLTSLAKEKSATLGGQSPTMDTWRKGLTLYSQNHFTAAKQEFQKVKNAYGSHRLVDDYIDNAGKQIAAGNDVPLYSPLLIVAAVAIGVVAVAGAVVLIVRHRTKHQVYLSGNMPPQPTAVQPAPQPGLPAAAQPAIPTQPIAVTNNPGSGTITPQTIMGPPRPAVTIQPQVVAPQQTVAQTVPTQQPQAARPIDQIIPTNSRPQQ